MTDSHALPAGAARAGPARTGWPAWPLLLAACAWLACTIWVRPLALPDEGRYVGVAWEMLRSGDWLVPTLDGLPYFHKPPLFYWITVVSMELSGVHGGSARAAPLLGGWLMLGACWAFARRWSPPRERAAWLLVLAGMPLVFVGAQYANLDMLVAGCISACVLCAAHAVLAAPPPGRGGPRPALLGAWGFAALGLLAKGLIGAVLPALVLVAWLGVLRRPRAVLQLLSLPGLLLFLAIAAPWFVLMQLRFADFGHYFFVVQHFSRYTGQGFNNGQPAWFFPVVLLVLALPWSAWLFWRAAWRGDAGRHREVRLLMLCWLLVVVVFFSLPASKLIGYVLPAMVPFAWLLAQGWQRAWERTGRLHAVAGATVAAGAIACVGAVVASARLPQQHNSSAIAAHVATDPSLPLVAIEAYPFDLALLAGRREPLQVVERWSDPARLRRDDWRRELADAARFAPARGDVLLEPSMLAAPGSCPGARSWVVAAPDAPARYAVLADAQQVAATPRLVLWQVRDWAPTPAACAGGRPTANSMRTS